FIEHLGRAVYTGIYEPGHPEADEQGFRKDVISLVRDLGITLTRYPGGNFVSSYKWTDGIGPRANRPRRLDYAWKSTETNEIGIDEFADWCKKADTRAMAAVNLGTGSLQDAGDMIEYCNHPSGTYLSDLRIKNGHKAPHKITHWCLGNEMDGPWQTGQLSAEEYGKKARETAKILKMVDPSVKLVACGSSSPLLGSYPEWDRIVLEHPFEQLVFISLHRYYENEGDIGSFLASYLDMDSFIRTIASTADYVKAKTRSKKTLMLSFDEWNVWYMKKFSLPNWEIAPPLLEDIYSLLDAIVCGGMLCALLNNADRVKIACLAQLVNVIAPIFTRKNGEAVRQAIYYPFQQVSVYGRGTALKTLVRCPSVETKTYGSVPVLQTAATYRKDTNEFTFFALHSGQKEDIALDLDLRSFGEVTPIEQFIIDGPDLDAKNTFENLNAVVPKVIKLKAPDKGQFLVKLTPLSWNVLRFKVKKP
ncbi:MAG: alpha-N-arabinofuranosidase, partial [Spirochaetaceae bacterium]